MGRVHRHLLDTGGGVAQIDEAVGRRAPLLNRVDRADIVRRVEARLTGLGSIQPLLHEPDVSEVMINGPGPVRIERRGRIEPSGIHIDRAELDLLVERIIAPIGRLLDPRRPWVDGRLSDGSRVNIIAPPVAIDGPIVTIRRFVLQQQTLDAFGGPEIVARLRALVDDACNVIVSGGTGAGKTTLLNALAAHLAPELRVITVEDAAELCLSHDHVVRLEARPAGSEGVGQVEIRDLVRNALRMRPDRLVIGEVRGPEALDLVQALNTGHAGCLATLHANSPVDALRRLATLALSAGSGLPLEALRMQICSAVDVVVQVARTGGAQRKVVDIAEVVGPDEVRSLLDSPTQGP